MTNFLPAGIIKDTITDIHQKTVELKNERDLLKLKKGISEIEDITLDLAIFFGKAVMRPDHLYRFWKYRRSNKTSRLGVNFQ